MRLIEAEKAKDVIHEYFKSLMVNGTSGADVDRLAVGIGSCLKHDANLLKAIDELPSAQPERKVGRWIPCPQSASWLYVYKCSECGGYLQISDVDGKGYKANYCSYCGAKMERGEQE